ncbi:MAG: hypothetical protein Pg6B_10500 [Candidatus Azobacteroides pseudotrichonymphae]|nr:MAG: hypothetical protein Pg6B_10500 [Candidatus Azobacteroides pseudotrichonymphae]
MIISSDSVMVLEISTFDAKCLKNLHELFVSNKISYDIVMGTECGEESISQALDPTISDAI